MVSENDTIKASPILATLNELKTIMDVVCRGIINEHGIYGCALRACAAKCFEFTLHIYQDPPPINSFFFTATLRGICEDLIVFTYINQLTEAERVEALHLLMSTNIKEGVNAQSEFFGEFRPWQPVVQLSKKKSETENKLRALSKKLGWTGRQAWPSVWHMAKSTNLHAIYNYLYAATSKWVHFSPQILLRMGWGGSKDNVGDHTEWSFSTTHFSQYYIEFNRIYSLMLLLKIYRGPVSALLPIEAEQYLTSLQKYLDEPLRWPEAVTYEELNLEEPKSFQRILFRAAYEVSKEQNM